jgi:hypothetical protein
LEVDFIRATGSTKDSGFIKLGDGNEKLLWTNQHTHGLLTLKLPNRAYWSNLSIYTMKMASIFATLNSTGKYFARLLSIYSRLQYANNLPAEH